MSSGMTRSPILRTTSPSARDATRCRSTLMSSASSSSPSSSSLVLYSGCCTPCKRSASSCDEDTGVSIATRRRTNVSRTSLNIRGVFGTTVFQTSTAACRTPCTASKRAIYSDEIVLRQAAPPMRFRSLFAVSSSPKAASASSNSATPTCLASPIRQSNSPNKRAAASRRRHLGPSSWPSSDGSSTWSCASPCARTSCLPANKATSRIASASSANPSSTAFNASCTWSPKSASSRARNLKHHNAPSRAAGV
mmetsp:Transcript_22651/g.63878  ORF Transcript_22651/g.63878 Transcript_22651/m.63878 type:complete len:251 (+) Transcript_22651:544-1296(+)